MFLLRLNLNLETNENNYEYFDTIFKFVMDYNQWIVLAIPAESKLWKSRFF